MRFEQPTPPIEEMGGSKETEDLIQIADAKDFGDLFDAIRVSPDIKDSEVMINVVRRVIAGKLDYLRIPNSEVRNKVVELLEKEQREKEEAEVAKSGLPTPEIRNQEKGIRTEEERIRNLLTPESVNDIFSSGIGVNVTILESSGQINDGWLLMYANPDGSFNGVKTTKSGHVEKRKIFLEDVVDARLQKIGQVDSQRRAGSPEVKKEKTIGDAKDFPDLFAVIKQMGGIEGRQKRFTSDELISLINAVRKGDLGPQYVTSSEGLRQKVMDLMEKENIS